jgi:hypothetical protein
MILIFKTVIFFTTVLLGAITCLTGCATTGMDRATITTNSMQAVGSCDQKCEVTSKKGTGQ